MNEWLSTITATYSSLLKENPVYAGFITVYLTTIVGWILRNLPRRFVGFIRQQSTTHIALLSSGAGTAELQYFSFQQWFVERGFLKYSRHIAVESNHGNSSSHDHTMLIAPGNGVHFFIWRRRLCWLVKSRVEQNGTTNEITHELTVTMVGRSKDLLIEMVKEFRWVPKPDIAYMYYPDRDGTWRSSHPIAPRSIDTVLLNENVKEDLLHSIEWFLNNRQWFEDRGFPYRLIMVLEGPPGTGKSSLLRALATHFKRSLCLLDLTNVGSEKFSAALRKSIKRSFVLMEDFDGIPATTLVLEEVADENLRVTSGLSRTAFLQGLDGVDVLDGQIVFLTTNHIDKIDPAVLRPERVSQILHIGLLENETIHRYILRMFPDGEDLSHLIFLPITGARLQQLYRRYPESRSDFVENIPKETPHKQASPLVTYDNPEFTDDSRHTA